MNLIRPVRLFRPLCVGLLACLLASSGCSIGLPQAQNDPTKFYVLSVPVTAGGDAKPNAAVVRLRPVDLAGYLRVRPLIVRRGENEVEFREFARWGEPLEQGITRVLRESLLATGAASAVDAGGLRPAEAGDVKFEISVRVLACEGVADGSVNFRAVWDIVRTAPDPAPALHGVYHPTALKWTPKNEATLAAALSRAVAGLAEEIAGGLAKEK
jgi:uncharacterized lipoprotein YmbA